MQLKTNITKMRLCSVLIVLSCILGFCCSCSFNINISASKYKDLGIPLEQRYDEQNTARNIWDMTVFCGKLYIGSGDYDKNEGPVDVWYYDISKKEWVNNGQLMDEQINRFVKIDNNLIIPGTDPMEDWAFGNYYILGNNSWEEVRTIPGGIHNFDMVKYDGKLFAGIGVDKGSYPIVSSGDNGKSFSQVTMWKGGALLNTENGYTIRVYDLIVLQNTLYALLWYDEDGGENGTVDLYRYEDGKFVYDNSWLNKVKAIRNWYTAGEKIVYKDRLFFTFGYLFTTDNMNDLTYIKLPDVYETWDMIVENDTLFVLSSDKMSDGTYRISVFENKTGLPQDFKRVVYFNYEIPARSFTFNDNVFYFGMGALNSESNKVGTVLSVQANF